jgi:hypothetical protein
MIACRILVLRLSSHSLSNCVTQHLLIHLFVAVHDDDDRRQFEKLLALHEFPEGRRPDDEPSALPLHSELRVFSERSCACLISSFMHA